MSNTNPQAPGRTFSIKSPLSSNAILTKTVIEKNENYLFHCLALASDSKYLISSSNERDNIVSLLMNKFKAYSWENEIETDSKNKLVYNASKDVIKDLYKNFEKNKEYKLVETKKISSSIFTSDKMIQFYKILFELVSEDKWKKIFKLSDKEARKYINSRIEDKLGKLDDKRSQIMEDCFLKLLVALKKECSDMALKEFLKDDVSVSLKDIKTFENIIKCDIFVLNENGLPKTSEDMKNENRMDRKEAIILFENRDNKVNVVGKLLAGNEVMRKFDSTDILIKRIKACFDKDVLKRQYRDLYDIIYKKEEKQIKKRSSESDDSSRSKSNSEKASSRSSSRSSKSSKSSSKEESEKHFRRKSKRNSRNKKHLVAKGRESYD